MIIVVIILQPSYSVVFHKWPPFLWFRDLEREKEKEELRMKKLKEEELMKSKKTAKKDAKELTKKKSVVEMKEV